jgi:hypothetical protein
MFIFQKICGSSLWFGMYPGTRKRGIKGGVDEIAERGMNE